MSRSLLDMLLDGPFELAPQPEPIAGDLRPAWGIALLVLILGRSRGKRASLQKLHFVAHSARTREARQQAQRVFDRLLRPAELLVRVEPSLNRAIAFAKGYGLIDLERGRTVKLTDKGSEVLKTLLAADTVMAEEKGFLDAIGPLATEAAIDKIMRMELSL
jgi:hypothetical protein